jgi:hypothetical protein
MRAPRSPPPSSRFVNQLLQAFYEYASEPARKPCARCSMFTV